jgi:hypothetical protein
MVAPKPKMEGEVSQWLSCAPSAWSWQSSADRLAHEDLGGMTLRKCACRAREKVCVSLIYNCAWPWVFASGVPSKAPRNSSCAALTTGSTLVSTSAVAERIRNGSDQWRVRAACTPMCGAGVGQLAAPVCVCVCWLALCVHFCSCAAVSSATGLPAEVLRLQRQRLIAGPLGHKDWLAMHSVVLDV